MFLQFQRLYAIALADTSRLKRIRIMEALGLARGLLLTARRNELMITKDLQGIAGLLDAEMVGLENKFKSEKSLARK